MAACVSTYLANAILNHVLKGTAYSQPTNLYLALSTANPTVDGSGLAEPSGGSYARKQINTAFDTAAARAVTTDTQIDFVTATGSWGTITHWAIYDASSAGNMLFFGAWTTSKVVGNGDTLSIAVGDLDISFAS